jgi:hypothetical protein
LGAISTSPGKVADDVAGRETKTAGNIGGNRPAVTRLGLLLPNPYLKNLPTDHPILLNFRNYDEVVP